MPVSNPERAWLTAAVESVLAQSYRCWQLAVCDDASGDPWVAEYLGGLAASDRRVRFTRSESRLGISGALNAAGALASGDYVAFLDHDDVLHADALYYVARACQDPAVKIVYTDEDYLDESGFRVHPQFKPDWSPDLLLTCMYCGHLFVAARESVDRAGWFRPEFDGSQDYDLALRLTDEPLLVRHIPLVLYHWRRHPASTAASPAAKPYSQSAGRRALEDALRRRSIAAAVDDGARANTYYVRRKSARPPLVSLIICSRNPKRLARCLRSIDGRTDYANREFVVVRDESVPNRAFDAALTRFQPTVVSWHGRPHLADMRNAAAQAAHGEIYVFLNDEVQAIRPDWLSHLAGRLDRTEARIAGPKLIYASGAIQHAGIATGIGDGAGHPGRGLFQSDNWTWLDLTRNVSAVSGACLAIRRSAFDELGGFDSGFPVSYNDVDLCLRARERGYLVVYEPHAVLRYNESRTRTVGTPYADRARLYERWADVLSAPDPYYSPAFDRATEEIRLGDPAAGLQAL